MKVDMELKVMAVEDLGKEKSFLFEKNQSGIETEKKLQEKIQQMELDLGDTRRQLQSSEERCSQLVAHKENLEANIADMINTSTDSSSQLTKLINDIRLKEKEVEVLNLKLSNQSRECEKKEQEFNLSLWRARKEFEDRAVALNAELESALESKKASESSSNERLAKLQAELSEVSREKMEGLMQERILSETLKEQEEKSKGLSRDLESALESVEGLTSRLGDSERRLAELESARADDSRERAGLVKEKTGLEREVGECKSRIALLEAESSGRLEELSKAAVLSDTLTERLDQREKSEKEKDAQILLLEGKIGELSATAGKQEEVISQLNKERISFLSTVELHAKEAEQKSANLQRLQDEVQRLLTVKETNEESNAVLAQGLKKLEIEKEEIEKQLRLSEETCSEQMERINRLESEKSLLSDSASSSDEIVLKLKSVLKQKEDDTKRLQDQHASSQKKLGEVAEELRRESESLRGENKRMRDDYEGQILKLADAVKSAESSRSEEGKKMAEKLFTVEEEKRKTNELLSRKIKELEERIKLQVDEAEESNRSNVKKISALEESRKVSEDEKQNSRITHDQLQDERLALQERVSAMSRELESLDSENRDLVRKLEDEGRSSDSLKEECGSLRKELSAIEGAHRSARESGEAVSKLESRVKDLERALKEKDGKLTSSLLELDSMKRSSDTKKLDPSVGSVEEADDKQGEINFLNSIICDLQKRNEELKGRIDTLELGQGNSSQQNGLKKVITPRMFCDICDMFDLHDTEDCPRQASSSPTSNRPHHQPGTRDSVERPYCEICEMFGHNTEDCDDEQTF